MLAAFNLRIFSSFPFLPKIIEIKIYETTVACVYVAAVT
jgi:hypothetical protein